MLNNFIEGIKFDFGSLFMILPTIIFVGMCTFLIIVIVRLGKKVFYPGPKPPLPAHILKIFNKKSRNDASQC